MTNPVSVFAGIVALSVGSLQAQIPCNGTTVAGTVRDATQALIPGAFVTLDGAVAPPNQTGPDGKFSLTCVPNGPHRLHISAAGFADRELAVDAPARASADVTLQLAVVVAVDVNGTDTGALGAGANSTGPTQTISGAQLQALADDPDDLLRELQQLAASTGGNPANVTISVDGFEGTSKLPPKSSIAYIKVNPDQFSAEYREPPFEGQRVEVYTKPGQPTYHGALFLTTGSPWENARDPFSTSKAAIGKQRYGFELTGPVRKVGSDFALTLEHRSIDDFGVVDAVTLDGGGNQTTGAANVPEPQRLWLGTARLDWQLSEKNTLITTYSANVNHLVNVGVGGTSLAETGYDSQQYEHLLRFSNITTISAKAMHEARLSLRWDGEDDTPASNAPQVQVAGAFTGGGSTLGPQRLHELDIEADDDLIWTPKNHTLKFGTQARIEKERLELTTDFNGIYVFGGTSTQTGLQQYQAGTATAFTGVTGTPAVNFTQVRDGLFFEDEWNAGHGLHVASGLRYFWQTDPTALSGLTPRLGILWSPNAKGTWTLHAHAGLFTGRFSSSDHQEVLREDGIQRVTSTIYNPVFGHPLLGGTPITSVRQYAPHIANTTYGIENIGGTYAAPGGWNLSTDYYYGRIWNNARTKNINSPLTGLPNGPRPGPANVNVLQVENSGQGYAHVGSFGVEQHGLKHVQLFFGGVHVQLIDDTNDGLFATPQSTLSEAGEFAPRSNQGEWQVFGNGTLSLPRKVQLSTDFHAGGDAHYNITTGFDNNGDGEFNDRPEYAAPGTPGAIQTRYGLLVANGGTGVLRRNEGVLPWTFYVDMNLQRAFTLTHGKNVVHEQTVTLNLRSSNVLNHLNVTGVGGVLGSPLFGIPYLADNGRRVEAGARYSF